MQKNHELVPGVDPDKDCLPPSSDSCEETDDADEQVTLWNAAGVNDTELADMALPQRGALSRFLERVMLLVERPVNWIVGAPQVNPFYYTGPIAIFLFAVISITGIFLVLFFQVGFDSSYLFISRVEHQPLTRIVRAAHRYASDAFVVVSLIHAYRLLVLERFRGARWLAWVSGVVMLAPIWLAGVTGYQLVWDERALAITIAFDNILQRGASSVLNLMATNQKGNSWIFIMIVLVAHLALTAVIGVAIWVHVARLNRPKWILPRYWMLGLTLVLFVVSAVAPVGMLPKADLTRAPGEFSIDLLYLFYLPAAFDPVINSPWLWIGLLVILVVAGILPWLSFRKTAPPRLAIDKSRCNGCTVCAIDCPYKAITLEPRTDGLPHKFVALEHPDLCVSCGICLGSCDSYAITLGSYSMDVIKRAVVTRLAARRAPNARVVLTCERHAAQHPHANRDDIVIALPCVGMAHPDLVGQIRQAGATDVQIVGCPPEDCANREGNTWLEQRLTRQRLPRLKKIFGDEPITMRWLAPDEFPRASSRGDTSTTARALTWRNFVPAFALLIIVLLVQIWITNVPFKP